MAEPGVPEPAVPAPATSEHVLVSASDGVLELRLNRPDKRNAITLAMYEALAAAFLGAEADESVKVILLSGAGASFTAGNDLNDFLRGPVLAEEHPAARFLRLLPNVRKVLVAAVHGKTVGIGVTLLLHCDLVLAARSTRLTMPFVKLGLVPEAGSSLLLPKLVGHQRASELLLLGIPLEAPAAAALGLINRVTEDETLLDEARALARAVAAQPPGALRATKRLIKGDTAAVATRIEEELRAFRDRLDSAEFRDAAQAFFSAKGR